MLRVDADFVLRRLEQGKDVNESSLSDAVELIVERAVGESAYLRIKP